MRVVGMGDWELGAGDEGLHAPGPEPLWNESFYLDFATPDGELGGYVRLGLYPNWRKAWYWVCLVGKDRPLTIIADHEAPLPDSDLAIRTSGYAATLQTVKPFEGVRVTLQSDELALDLEWRTTGGVYGYSLTPRYEVPCQVSGTVNGQPFEGYGERDHSWGVRDWWSISWLWSSGRLDDGTFLHGMQANVGMALPWPAFKVRPGGEIEHVEGFSAASTFGTDGLPQGADLRFPGLRTTVTPLHFAPVTLTSPDGQEAEFPRAMCRFEAEDGRRGYGWTEWHQPPSWRDHGWQPLL